MAERVGTTIGCEWLACVPPDCAVRVLEGARWGYLLSPPAPAATVPRGALRLVLFCSLWIGQAALQAALACQRRWPEALRIVGVVTDDPVSPQARISRRKRAWSLMDPEERLAVKLRLVETALDAGIPVYTGEVKTPGFRRTLADWAPEALITCGFGQLLDRALLDAPPLGAYNCHPSDLVQGLGAGPRPWEDLAARGATRTVWSVHRMTEVVDAGPVIGRSAEINFADADGRVPPDPRCFVYKAVPALAWIVPRLIAGLRDSKARGASGPLQAIDLAGGMPPALVARLAAPVAPAWRDLVVQTPGQAEFAALGALHEAAPAA